MNLKEAVAHPQVGGEEKRTCSGAQLAVARALPRQQACLWCLMRPACARWVSHPLV